MFLAVTPIKLGVFNPLGGSVVLYKDLIVAELRSARLLPVGVSEVLNALQTGLKKIYSGTYRRV